MLLSVCAYSGGQLKVMQSKGNSLTIAGSEVLEGFMLTQAEELIVQTHYKNWRSTALHTVA